MILCNACLGFFFVVVQCCLDSVSTTPEANFLSRIKTEEASLDDYDYYQTLYDSDVKIPGVHYPKLPYTKTDRRGFRLGYDEPRRNSLSRDVDDLKPAGDISPYFNRQMKRNITVQEGQVAYLACKVEHLGEKSVSWLRLEDLHVLTTGKYKYSTDKRIGIVYDEANREWRLMISPVIHSDAGLYECQISTKPILSFVVNLNVVDYYVPSPVKNNYFMEMSDQTAKPKNVNSPLLNSYILNSPDIYVYLGSLANLTCIVNHRSDPLEYILWYHKNEVINLRKGAIETTILPLENGTTISHLLIMKVQNENEGAYTCKPSNDNIASAMLHVLHEELQAAMQSNRSDKMHSYFMTMMLMSIFWATFS